MVVEDGLDDAKAGVVWIETIDAADAGALSKAVHNGRAREGTVVCPHQGWWDIRMELVQRFLLFEHNEVGLAKGVHTLVEWLAQNPVCRCDALRKWERLYKWPHGVDRPLL
jgi:hypothetical protein